MEIGLTCTIDAAKMKEDTEKNEQRNANKGYM